MKVLMYFPGAIPEVSSGAEWYEHQVILKMLEWGWDLRVCVLRRSKGGPVPYYSFEDMKRLVREGWPDIAISSHYYYRHLNPIKCPVYVIQHSLNFQPFDFRHVNMIYCAEHVMNSHAAYMAKSSPFKSVKRSMVFRPPQRLKPAQKPRKAAGGYVTLVNLCQEKGGHDFKTINLLMPDVNFLGVQGPYGTQKLIQPKPDNVTYWANRPDMQEVYDKTSILLMLSKTEGLPTVILEAMSQGIPVISYPIPGAVEALGDAGVYANNAHEVPAKINEVLANYAHYSKMVLDRYHVSNQCWKCLKDFFTL